MPLSRMFIAHEALEQWVAQGRALVDAEALFDRETGRHFRVTEALRFVEEVTGLPDTAGLVGRVKTLADVTALGGEHMADSVILHENAYRVQPGFLGALIVPEATVAPAARAGAGESAPNAQTIAALQKFFLHNVK